MQCTAPFPQAVGVASELGVVVALLAADPHLRHAENDVAVGVRHRAQPDDPEHGDLPGEDRSSLRRGATRAGLEVLDQLRRHPRRRPRARRAVPDAKEKDARFGLWTATVRSRVTLSRGASPTRRAETRRVVGSRTRSTVRNRAARVAARSTSTPKVAARHMTQRWTCCWTTAWRRGWGERCRLMCPL
jgi:hypothetical protein